jgi:SAM-dependent methyltransferase
MQFNFKINSQNIRILVSDSEDFRREFLVQKGAFGLGPDITTEEIEHHASRDHVNMIEKTAKYFTTDQEFTVLDIGAGNSVADLVLAKLFNNSKFILLDGDEWTGSDEIHSINYQPYNHWQHVEQAVDLNQLDRDRFSLVGLDYAFDTPVDLIMSCGAWGLHFPIELYLESAVKALKPGGIISLAPVLNINNSLEKINSVLTPLEITDIDKGISSKRNANDWGQFSKYFPEDFTGSWGYAGIWRKD